MRVEKGSKTGLITDSQESSTTPHHRANPNENQGDSSIVDAACDDSDGSTNGRRGTRTPDIYFVRVAL